MLLSAKLSFRLCKICKRNIGLRVRILNCLNVCYIPLSSPPLEAFEILTLQAVVTATSYQRRGIGSRLVNVGLEKADKEGVEVYLSGSPMGVPVYKKLGFEEVGRIEIPLQEYGGKEGEVHVHGEFGFILCRMKSAIFDLFG